MKFMQRQTYTGDVVWIIVDDCIPTTTDKVTYNFKQDWTIIKSYPKPTWKSGQNTQFRNIINGTDVLTSTYDIRDIRGVFIIEDDDYYKPTYIQGMVDRLKGYDLIGEKNSIYYNIVNSKYIIWSNELHASLFQTGFTPKMIPMLQAICRNPSPYPNYYIDVEFWQRVKNKSLFNDGNLAIGIKGIGGRPGIGAGHDNNLPMTLDSDGSFRRNLFGVDEVLYAEYMPHAKPPIRPRPKQPEFRPLGCKRPRQ